MTSGPRVSQSGRERRGSVKVLLKCETPLNTKEGRDYNNVVTIAPAGFA